MTCIFHRWITLVDTGFRRYQECSKCGKRRADRTNPRRAGNGRQPIDDRWLRHDTDDLFRPMSPPPPNGRVVAERRQP